MKHLKTLKIVSRKSPLALRQSEMVARALESAHAELKVSIDGITTEGDRRLGVSLAKVGGKGLFVKELETVLLDKRADIAVHSLKDVPVDWIPELCLGAILKRAAPWDILVSNRIDSWSELPLGATIGTASLRRQSQLLYARPDLKIILIRGNIHTRLAHLGQGKLDALILAEAGLTRMDLPFKSSQRLDALLLPAVGQGALAIQCRVDDERTRALIAVLNDPISAACVTAERSMNAILGGGCTAPIAGLAVCEPGVIFLKGLVAAPDGQELLRAEARKPIAECEALGREVAFSLNSQGAQNILASFKDV